MPLPGYIEVNLGVGIPGFHACQGAWTKDAALRIEVFRQNLDNGDLLRHIRLGL
jgi:hypothetical protein